ncbi:unnamed protein product [Cylicostephanus goldi]|uniref:Uncharacterized protein n=1 Tax=Cylicostephanus goldi TaxID=71465 RepID=A0A3P7MQA7_CYLGO|nr:unnamed protein product [Cylicostephanus goldi]
MAQETIVHLGIPVASLVHGIMVEECTEDGMGIMEDMVAGDITEDTEDGDTTEDMVGGDMDVLVAGADIDCVRQRSSKTPPIDFANIYDQCRDDAL